MSEQQYVPLRGKRETLRRDLEREVNATNGTQEKMEFCKIISPGFPSGASSKEPSCQCRRHKRHEFKPWVRKILWRSDRLPTPVVSGFPEGSDG